MKKSQQAALLRTIIISAIFILAGVGYYFYRLQPGWDLYRDEGNRISLEKPEGWFAGSIEGYARVAEDTTDPSKPSVLIKMEYPESIIESLGLDTGEQVVVGEKSVRRVDHEWEVPGREGVPTSTQTFTFLMWDAPDGRKIIFEITPWQKPGVHESVERIVRTFNSI